MRFGAGWLSAGVAALLLTSGCKEGKPVNEQATAAQSAEQAQKQSEKAFGQAQHAQEKATDEQKDAAQAQRNLEDAQQNLTEAQSKARTEAEQARQAQQQTQQAQQTVAQSQASALEAQRQQQNELAQQNQQQAQQSQQAAQAQQQAAQPVAQAPAPSTQAQGEQLIVGQVLTANDQEVLVSSRGEPQVRLQVQPGTVIMVDGRQARAVDIEEGSQVRASFHDQGGEPTATRIEVTTSQRPTTPAPPESGESTPGSQEAPFQRDQPD